MKEKLAVQMYTLRNECAIDFIGTLEAVAELGYKGVELAGFYGFDAADLAEHLERLRLKVAASHTSLDELEHNIEVVIAYNKTIGNKNIVCPYSEWKTQEEFDNILRIIKSAGKKIKDAGLNFYYHNHAHELVPMNDFYALDYIFLAGKEVNLKMELDTYWVKYAGVDPVEYMDAYKKRCRIIHLKDMVEVEGKQVPAAVGDGTMPIMNILAKAKELDVEWIIVENDFPKPNGIDNIARSMVFLKGVL